MMRIVFCIKKLAGVSGGAEWVLTSVANGLSRRGYVIYVLSFDNDGAESFYKFSQSVHLINLGGGGANNVSRVMQLWRMKRAAARLKPDVVFGFLPSTFVALSVLFYFTNIKFIACEHIIRDWYKSHWIKYFLVTLAGNISFRISFLSKEIAKDYAYIASKRKVVLNNPVRIMSKTANVMAKSKTVFTILNVGRLVEFKDQKTLIEAFSRIRDDFPNWRLRIIGQGELKGQLSLQIESLELGDVAKIIDRSDDIEGEYANSDIFIVSSTYEGFGLVTAEASSAGLPCVGFRDSEGTNKIIRNGDNGILVEPSDNRVEALAACMRELLGDRKRMRQLGTNGLSRPASYELEYVLDRWEEVIKLT